MKANKKHYEHFHAHVQPPGNVPEKDDWMYHYVLEPLSKYIKNGDQVLEIGTGTGIISLFMAKNGCSVLGIDISENAIKAATQGAKNFKLQGKVKFKPMLLEDIKKGKPYDMIVMSEVLEHIPDDQKALQISHNLLHTDGLLFLSVPSKRSPAHKIRMLVHKKDKFDEEVGHLRRYSKKALKKIVEKNNFEVLEIRNGEGPLRNLFFTTKRLNPYLYKLVKFRMRRILEAIDVVLSAIFGEAQIILVAKSNK